MHDDTPNPITEELAARLSMMADSLEAQIDTAERVPGNPEHVLLEAGELAELIKALRCEALALEECRL